MSSKASMTPAPVSYRTSPFSAAKWRGGVAYLDDTRAGLVAELDIERSHQVPDLLRSKMSHDFHRLASQQQATVRLADKVS